MTDPIADLLTRIRNAQHVRRPVVCSPHSKMRERILAVLRDEGYIRGYSVAQNDAGHPEISVELKYHEGKPVIQKVQRVSKPGRRVYTSIEDLKPFHNYLGIHILSTSKGVMSDVDARRQSLGGEVLCSVF